MADDNMTLGYLMGADGNNNNSGGGFGGDFGSGLWAIIILAMLGFGRNGFGGGYGNDGGGNGYPCATQADVRAAVDQQTLISKLDQQTYGLADSTYALNNGIVTGFHGVDNAICTLGYQTQTSLNALGAQMAQCCCDTRAAIQENTTQGVMNTNAIQRQISDCCCDIEKMNMQSRFDAQAYNCNTLQAIDRLGDRIIDYMSQDKMQALRDENQALRLAASQSAQNQYLVNQLRPAPVPAFSVPAPFHFGGWGGNGCGCGCGC